ncbi:STAS domain-containing protein [Seonamhaeicola maritimus]|uniref:STAS domain-containing protein n=1 Tax=Seonamhaeicola maritimus TaxID=2591822 RepID=UPI002493F3E7|nr:STAS domain-containing protein [Seonamhaeicola maritimus]
MSLKITEKEGTFYLDGSINTLTSSLLENHFTHLLYLNNELTINIEGVNEINSNGVSTLLDLYFKASKNNKRLWFTGYGSKDIYNQYNSLNPV